MRALRPLALLALAVVLSGCFQTKTLIRLNADGSGTVEETVLMNSTMAMTVMMGGMNLFAEEEEEDEAAEMPDGPYTMEALEARAAEMGATLAGVEPIDVLFGAGYTATYAFDDINALRLSSDPSDGLPSGVMSNGMGMGDDADGEDMDAAKEPVTFAFSEGRLTVKMPHPASGDDADDDAYDPKKDPDDEPDEDFGMQDEPGADDLRQMQMMLKDMRFSLAVELPGAVTQTNALHASGRTLTLYDMDFGVLAQSPGAFDQLQALDLDAGPDLSPDKMAALAGIPGFVFEPAEEVTVSFE